MATWDDSFTGGLDAWIASVEAAAPGALAEGMEYMKARSAERAPLREGHLEQSGEVIEQRVDGLFSGSRLRYPGPYARRQEFELTWHHPRKGQALYLTTTFRVDGPACMDVIAQALRRRM